MILKRKIAMFIFLFSLYNIPVVLVIKDLGVTTRSLNKIEIYSIFSF